MAGTNQRLVNKMLANLNGKIMEVHVDDMLINSLATKEYMQHLDKAF